MHKNVHDKKNLAPILFSLTNLCITKGLIELIIFKGT